MRARILELLGSGPLTVPELAAAMDCPTHEVLFWVMGMRRYGRLREVGRRRWRGLLPLRGHRGSGLMTTLVDTELLSDVQRYGAADVSACFSCGTCTASCPLVSDDANFPRRIIRYAQVGMRDQLLGSKELWTCYACGECSESLPDPGRTERVHGRRATIRHRRLRPDRPGPDAATRGPSWAPSSPWPWPCSSPLFMYAGRGEQSTEITRHLRVHPGGTHPRLRRSWS